MLSDKVQPHPSSCQTGYRRRLPATALVLVLCAAPVSAQTVNTPDSDVQACNASNAIRFRGATARLENDLFADTDQNYTSGVAFTAVSHDIFGKLNLACLPAAVRLHSALISYLDPGFWADADNPAHAQNVVVKFGQSMFTPRDSTRTDLIPDDRPYAGLLYVGMSWNRRKHEPHNNTEVLETREITLGVIGPLALAQPAQDLIHDVIGAERFQGWDNQLRNEPAVQMALDRKFKTYQGAGAIQPGFSADYIRSLGLQLGNIETSGTVGIEGRIGWNIPNDFGTYPIRPGAENRPPSAASIHGGDGKGTTQSGRPRAGVHLFGTLETKLVLHDFSLDGNLFESSHSVTRSPWVAQAAIGLSAQSPIAGHGVKLAVMRVWRTREFEEQGSSHAYGSVTLSIEF
jgi:lipid A 3-O-deacylase